MFWIIWIVLVIALIYALRTVGLILLLVSIVYWFTSPDDAQITVSAPKVMSYQELVDYPVSCEFKDQQLVELTNLQTLKNFDSDPDKLDADSRAYNSRLKATRWWYEYRCGSDKVTDNDAKRIIRPRPTEVKSEIVNENDCQNRVSVTLEGNEILSSNTLTVCGKSNPLEAYPKVKIGGYVFETDLQYVPEIQPTYFSYQKANCRLFRERYMSGNSLQSNHGIICQITDSGDMWQVLDKW